MASDYESIRADNERRYGTDIGRIGPMLLANRYDDRTHFIFELLQNAEDALSRRDGWQGSRAVAFHLADSALRISHFGKPFDERDVRGVCGIDESTKDVTAIGRFGIGFKSVYAFTDRPEIHSGTEDFAIECFVWPIAAPPVECAHSETVIRLPLKDDADINVIAEGLKRLGARSLLFLRQIEEIEWRVQGGPSGVYLRGKPETLAENVRRVAVIGQEVGKPEIEESWLVFSRGVKADDAIVGYVEIAFSIARAEESEDESIEPVTESPLVAFFPTVVSTYLGFLVQGPYRTTPSRDNVPRSDQWNQGLVCETAAVLLGALRWLRDNGMLDAATLRCLPLDPARFSETQMFAPLFEATRQALKLEALLPRSDGGHVAAVHARIARTQDLRELISPSQLGGLFGHKTELAWLSGDITLDRTPELRQYLIRELGIVELTSEAIIPKLGKTFLEAQTDNWILRLYEFLGGQPALLRSGRLSDVPLVRLLDGTHVLAKTDGLPQAVLPGAVLTSFPTVRPSVCASTEARQFLETLDLTEPDAVDDVIWNVLPIYRAHKVARSGGDYEADIRRILAAFATDSKEQREKLLAALRETEFVMSVDMGNGSKWLSKPDEVYLAAERLKDLLSGVPNVLLVDDGSPCLRGEDVREMLEACGATRYLRPVAVTSIFTREQLRHMRIAGGCEDMSSDEAIEDHSLRGLDGLLNLLPTLDITTRAIRAGLLWEALGDLEDRRGTGIFSSFYRWQYYSRRSTTFEAAFARQLNETAWVPGPDGQLERPEFVVFDTLGWKPNPFLQSKIRFKPPIIEALAKQAGIEPGVLELLKKLGVTSEADLRDRLRLDDEPTAAGAGLGDGVEDALKKLLGNTPEPTPPILAASSDEPKGPGSSGGDGDSGNGSGGAHGGGNGTDGHGDGPDAGHSDVETKGSGKRTPGGIGGRPFISYVATHPDDDGPDPDGLDQAARMALETKAINIILAHEPEWRCAPTHNPGYDLFAPGEDATPSRWCEVKAMTGSLHNRPIGLSRTQFECARQHGAAFWLYIVERAGDDSARIVRIQDPAGKARTFTFDRGWLDIADVSPEQKSREE